jgi:hypothetical protein
MAQDKPWERYAASASPSGGPQVVVPNPYAVEEAGRKRRQAEIDAAKEAREQAKFNATAPYEATTAAANAAKAQADAEKAKRDLAAQQATASPEQQKRMADLANDEVLAAIAKARGDVDAGWSTGYAARVGQIPLVGGLLAPQNAVNLEGSLNTIASRLTLDKLAQLKQSSPTGASGLGSLTEREGALLRDSVASLGQTQSKERILENLASVERHYRNLLALTNGEDYRDPKIAEKYGIVAMPSKSGEYDGRTGGDDSQIGATLAPAGAKYREEPDPALRGVNARVRAMVGAGRSAQDITDYLNKVRPGLGDANAPAARAAVAFRAQNPRIPLDRYVVSLENRQVPMDGVRSTLNTVAQTPGGAAVTSAFDAMTAFNAHNLTENPELARAGINQIAEDNPLPSFVGTLGGGALAGAGIEAALPARLLGAGTGLAAPRLLAADAVYGGAAGYGNGDGSLGDTLKGAGEAIAGGVIGRGAVRGLGAAARGVTNPDAQLLRSAQVPMTIGQMMGGRMARREDRLAGYGGIGDTINEQRRRGLVEMNRAAFREAAPAAAQGAIGNVAEDGIEQLQQVVSGTYDNALNGRNFDLTDPQFVADYGAARTAGAAIPRTGPEFAHYADERVLPHLRGGAMNGREAQDVLQGLRDADFGTDAMGSAANDAAGNARTAVVDMINRQAPDVMPQLTEADQAYRRLNVLADAVGRGMNTEGIFTGAQLGQAARANSKRFNGPIAAATTNRPFYDLQRAAQNVLPSKVPDSGTAGRIEAGRGILGGIKSAARSAVNAPLYAEGLQPIIAQILMDRPDVLRRLGERIERNPRIGQAGGLFGAPLLVQRGVVQDY